MPELPEVETVKSGLQPVMEGATIGRVELSRPDLRFPLPPDFSGRLRGRTVLALSRRAKYLLADLSGDLVLAMHLGMSGSFRIERDDGAGAMPGIFHHPRGTARLHDHVVFELVTAAGEPARIIYNDPRRFGFMTLLPRVELAEHPLFRHLGLEPTGNALTPEALADRLAGRNTPLKAALLDQTIIAGLGNIYVCEALWRARLSPRRRSATLVDKRGRPTPRLAALTGHIRETIHDAIAAGGSSLRDYRQADGSLGYFQHRFAVYDREGEPCHRTACGGIVRRILQAGRSTFYCPACQR